ncbi:MAG: HAMP domain-containing histidine kinase [Lachnospiraceae bacterium]|nr:HAMP domain-containing histidine kinase [Lachnospiraceae bacterium]
MKQKFLYRLRKDTDMIWKGGMGAVLILLLLCMGLMRQAVREEDFFVRTDQCMKLVAVYGVACLALFAGAYYMIVRSVSGTLWQLGDMIESLTEGQVKEVFPVAGDTILSRLQNQVMRLYDILRSYEEREQKMRRQLDENIGDLVHQLNTPITNIRLYAEFLRRDDLTVKECERFLCCLEEQAQKLSWLGESFSKISRLETGIIRLKPERQDLQPIILRAVGQIMEKAQRRGMEIALKGDVQSEVVADAKWTAEAVFNVLDNAVKYGDKGSMIEIEVTRLTNYTSVAIRNSGTEIDGEEYHNLFKRFYRGKGSGEAEGSGLGLYIVRKILEEEKGYIKAGRTNDGRTEFVLYLYHG